MKSGSLEDETKKNRNLNWSKSAHKNPKVSWENWGWYSSESEAFFFKSNLGNLNWKFPAGSNSGRFSFWVVRWKKPLFVRPISIDVQHLNWRLSQKFSSKKPWNFRVSDLPLPKCSSLHQQNIPPMPLGHEACYICSRICTQHLRCCSKCFVNATPRLLSNALHKPTIWHYLYGVAYMEFASALIKPFVNSKSYNRPPLMWVKPKHLLLGWHIYNGLSLQWCFLFLGPEIRSHWG